MGFRVVWLVKRKPGLTPEEFREHYINHVPKIKKYLGHLTLEYSVSFINEAFGGINEASSGKGYIAGAIPAAYDCVTTMTAIDKAAFDEGLRITQQPEVAKILDEDENKFIDHKAVVTYFCDEVVAR